MKYIKQYEKFYRYNTSKLVDSLISLGQKFYPDSDLTAVQNNYDEYSVNILWSNTKNLGLDRLVDRDIDSFLWLTIEESFSYVIRIGLSPLPEDRYYSLLGEEIRSFTINQLLIPLIEKYKFGDRGNDNNLFIDKISIDDLVNDINSLTKDDFDAKTDSEKYNL